MMTWPDYPCGFLARMPHESGVIDVHLVFKQRTMHVFDRVTAGS
jgi:hypothetical protein